MTDFRALAAAAVKRGNWIICTDHDGTSPLDTHWNPPGEWTEAPDWDPTPEYGDGLHGQDKDHGGYISGTRLLFCEFDPEAGYVPLNGKVKVRRARILLVNELPEYLVATGALGLSGCTGLTSLPDDLIVREWLALDGCIGLISLPKRLKIGGSLYLSGCTGLTSLPTDLIVGKWLYLDGCTGLTSLPDHLFNKAVGWSLV